MKTSAFIALLVLGLASRVAAADATPVAPPPTDVVIFDHAQVDAAFAKGLPLLINSSYKIQTGRRVMGGVVEIHEHDTDILWVTEGSATLVTGGKATATKPTGPGEIRGEKIEGGVTRHVTKGDVVVIPPNVPHWFNEVGGTFLYFVVKVTQ